MFILLVINISLMVYNFICDYWLLIPLNAVTIAAASFAIFYDKD